MRLHRFTRVFCAALAASSLLIGCDDPSPPPRSDAGVDLAYADVANGDLANGDLANTDPATVDDLAARADLSSAFDLLPAAGASLAITSPAADAVLSAPFSVTVQAQASAPIAAVTAKLGTQTWTFVDRGGGTFAADGVAPPADGPLTLVVTLTTTTGVTASGQRALRYLASTPTLELAAPLMDEVAHPALRMKASCHSALPGCVVKAALGGCPSAGSVVDASAVETLDQPLTPDPVWDGDVLCFEAIDVAGHTVAGSRTIHVEPSPTWHSAYDAAERILAVSVGGGSAYLVRTAVGWPSTFPAAPIDPAAGVATVRETLGQPGTFPSATGVHPDKDRVLVGESGAVLAWTASSHELRAYDAIAPVSELVGTVARAPAIHGDWLAGVDDAKVGFTYQLSKLGNGARTDLGSVESADVGAQGVSAYTTPVVATGQQCSGGELYLGGTKVAVPGLHSDVLTDGTSAVYRWQPGCSSSANRVALFDGSTQTPLSQAPTWVLDFRFSGGWTVGLSFILGSPVDTDFIWRRSPAGVQDVPAEPREHPLFLEALWSDGSFTYTSGRVRHLVDVQGVDHEVGAVHGSVYHTTKVWYVTLGRSLFEIVP